MSIDPRIEDILRRAQRMGEDGEYHDMAEILLEALTDDPEDPYLLCWLGVAERERGMEGIAYERFKQALAQDPQDPVLLSIAGTGLADFDDPEAEVALRTGALLGKEIPETRWRYGAWLTREGFVDDGIAELVAAALLNPEDGTIAYELGVGYALRGSIGAAIDAMDRAVGMEMADEGWVRAILGLLMVEVDRPDEAVIELDLAARARPEDPELQVLAALARAAEGEPDSAWEYLERARFRASGIDVQLVDEADERIHAGPEEAGHFLRTTVGPSTLRERLAVRP